MDIDYIKARHKVLPEAMRITSKALGIGITINHTRNSGEVGGSFDYSGFDGDCSKVMPVFLATMDQLYQESRKGAQS